MLSLFSFILKEVLDGKKIRFLKFPIILLLNPSKDAIFLFRLSQHFFKKKFFLLSKIVNNRLIRKYGAFISPKCEIGLGLKLKHINGVVIGEGVKIGKNAIIYHQVTIGGQNLGDSELNNYPIIGDNVTFFSGSKVFGKIHIGSNSVIGSNAVVIRDVDNNSVYAGIPAKKIRDLKP
jgi:serine O-acetyltransferase